MYRTIVIIAATVAAAFVLWLGVDLPENVASHFGQSGKPDGFMPRSVFVTLMCVVTAATPLLIWWLQARATSRGTAKIPNASHWFSGAQRAQTERFLLGHAAFFSVTTTAFLCYVYWLVVDANNPFSGSSSLDMSLFFYALGTFLAITVAWVVSLYVRFNKGI